MITDKGEQTVYQGTTVASDSDTKSLLYDWLQFREINDENEDKFLVFYRRNLDMFYPRYLLLLEDELTEIPQLDNFRNEITNQLRNYGSITDEIVRSIEREHQRTDNLTRTTDMARKDTGTIGNSETDTLVGTSRNDNQLNQNVTASSSSESSDDSTTHTDATNHSEGNDRARALMRQLPQSTEYGGVGQIGFDANGYPSKFDWSTATNQAEDVTDTQTDGTSSNNTTTSSTGEVSTSNQSNTTNTGYTTGSSNQTNTYNKTQTNNTQSKDEGTVKDTGTQITNEGVDETSSNTRRLDDKHDAFTTEHGFRNMTEAQIRNEIWNYISNSIALQWFLGKMERCFIGVFD